MIDKNSKVYQTYRDWYCEDGECEYTGEERVTEEQIIRLNFEIDKLQVWIEEHCSCILN